MTYRERLQARLELLESDLRHPTSLGALARWPHRGGQWLRQELEVRIDEVKRIIKDLTDET